MIRAFPFMPMDLPPENSSQEGLVAWWASYGRLGSALLIDPVNFPPVHFLNQEGNLILFSSDFNQFLAKMTKILSSQRSFIYPPGSITFQQVCKAIARTIGCRFLYQCSFSFPYPFQCATEHLYLKPMKACVFHQLKTAYFNLIPKFISDLKGAPQTWDLGILLVLLILGWRFGHSSL